MSASELTFFLLGLTSGVASTLSVLLVLGLLAARLLGNAIGAPPPNVRVEPEPAPQPPPAVAVPPAACKSKRTMFDPPQPRA